MKKSKLIASLLLSLSLVTTIGGQYTKAATVDPNTTQFQMTKAQKDDAAAKEKKFKELVSSTKNKVKASNNQLLGAKDSIGKAKGTLTTALPDGYPTRAGIFLTTSDSSTLGLPHGHNGIIWSTYTTVEAKSENGVQRYSNDWTNRYADVLASSVNGTTSSQDNEASNWCYAKIDCGYNWNFLNTGTRDKFYCSQLIWAAFKDKYSINIDDDGGIIIPYDIALSKNVYSVWAWSK